MSARIVFFVVFIVGVIAAFFRNIYYGLEFRVTEKALVQPNSFFGSAITRPGADTDPVGPRAEYIPWEIVKEIADQEGTLLLPIKDHQEPLAIGVAPVAGYSPATPEEAAGFPKLFKHNEKLDKEALKKVVQKARDAKKALQQ